MKSPRAEPGIRRIAIDGHFLDAVQTRLQSDPKAKSLSYVSAPVEQHRATEDEQGITVSVPALTAVQLFYDGVLPADPQTSVKLSIGGHLVGSFYLHGIRAVSASDSGSPVLLRFGREAATRERPYDPNAWIAGLVPLKLQPHGEWDPAEEYWAEPGEPIEAWARSIIKRGPRPMYEMEQILPGADPEDFDSDPITEANELKYRGQVARAKKVLEKLLIQDVRCLDAHAHLGNLAFDKSARTALDHYERGVRIGELSLSKDFDGVLPWGLIDNRPFLRCLSGYGLCLWRLERFDEAESVFTRLLWMSPSDNLGMRFLLAPVKARKAWTPDG